MIENDYTVGKIKKITKSICRWLLKRVYNPYDVDKALEGI